MRSLLTILGIFIGVASVIWLLAIGEGISKKAQEQIESLGADNIIIRSIKPSDPMTRRVGRRPLPVYGLTKSDMEWIETTMPRVKKVIPIREIRRKFANGSRDVEGRLVGCIPEYAEVTHLKLDRGIFLGDLDVKSSKPVCVLSAGIAEKLFPFEDPVGKEIRVQSDVMGNTGYNFTVIGVMQHKDPTAAVGGSFSGQDFTFDVYIPITTLWDRLGVVTMVRKSGQFEGEVVEISQLTLRIDDKDKVLETADTVKSMLAKSHSKQDDYGVTVPLELLEQAKATRMMFIVFMGMIAAISLLVGGIGIMNIMLATVTERTREIGIRRALGAKQGDIVRQFLVETIVLSVVGGLVGVLVGLLCHPITTFCIARLKANAPDMMKNLPPIVQDIEPILVPISIPIAFGISVVIGVVFGLYPAVRAASMDPIEALRHE